MLILQFTGLSGSGKSTLAEALKQSLAENGFPAVVLDADVCRKTVNKDLGFSAADRKENIRRLVLLANRYCQAGTIAIIAAINPYDDVRKEVAERFGAKIVWVCCAMDILLERDTKGLYRRALLSDDDPQKIQNLSGINDPYEPPSAPDLLIDTGLISPAEATRCLLSFVLASLRLVPAKRC
jgi:adenylyl-sulfate kinase